VEQVCVDLTFIIMIANEDTSSSIKKVISFFYGFYNKIKSLCQVTFLVKCFDL